MLSETRPTIRRAERERLAERAAQGDAAAFSKLAVLYRPALTEHVRHRGVEPDRVEDVVQEMFLRAWEMRASYVSGGSWVKWCQRIATHLVIDEWRRAGLVEFVSLDALLRPASDDDAPVCRELVDPSPLPDAALVAKEEAERAERALRRLPPAQGTAMRMRLEGRSFEDIAETLHTARNTVRIYLYRARNTLRESLCGADNND
jgi:RNA polymerase sigma-70 factor (ECF subfamily)